MKKCRGEKQLLIILALLNITLCVYYNAHKATNVKTLDKTKFEEITETKAENNIGEVPIIEKKVEVKENKETEKNTKKAEKSPSKSTKTTKTKKKVAKTTQNVSYNKSELQQYAHDLVIQYGWSEYDFECLVNLWNRESGWSPNAVNKKSGACGIPQSLPCNKMASHGSDYRTNGKTQIRWGLDYIKNRYGSPSNAWAHSQQKGWY